MNWENVETERLLLKGIDKSDTDFIFMHFKDEYVCRYLYDAEPFTSFDEAKQLISVFGNKDNGVINRWIIMDKVTKTRMGTCGYMFWDKFNNSIEIGYDLQEEFCGKGIMIEALRAIINKAFTEKGINRIQAITYIENKKSCNLLEKIGFSKEGIIREKHYFRGKYYDHFCYSLLKNEWDSRIA